VRALQRLGRGQRQQPQQHRRDGKGDHGQGHRRRDAAADRHRTRDRHRPCCRTGPALAGGLPAFVRVIRARVVRARVVRALGAGAVEAVADQVAVLEVLVDRQLQRVGTQHDDRQGPGRVGAGQHGGQEPGEQHEHPDPDGGGAVAVQRRALGGAQDRLLGHEPGQRGQPRQGT
jgi:hypothetical protein